MAATCAYIMVSITVYTGSFVMFNEFHESIEQVLEKRLHLHRRFQRALLRLFLPFSLHCNASVNACKGRLRERTGGRYSEEKPSNLIYKFPYRVNRLQY